MLRAVTNLYESYRFFKKPPDLEDEFYIHYARVKDFTMTPPVRLYALWNSVKYLIRSKTPGDIVECGVWKGGSMMLIANILRENKDIQRMLYLYDTFKGMPEPENADINFRGTKAIDKWILNAATGYNKWDYASLDEVKSSLATTLYPQSKIKYVPGMVEQTLKADLPEKISLLRLDTDLYSSTSCELKFLYPRLVKGGILIIDDYGHWLGSKKAVDEYLNDNKINMLLTRVDYSARIGIKI